jgi:hypothetical protein
MKVIVAGCRDFYSHDFVAQTIEDSGFVLDEIVSGGAAGVDNVGQWYAHNNKIKCTTFPADWNKNGKAAGPIRNTTMANYADALILIWDGVSSGSRDMLQKMLTLKKPVFIRCFRRQDNA